MTAYEIDNIVLKRFDGKRGPNVVYTKLANLERQGLISCTQAKHGKIYNITESGREMTDAIPTVIKEMQSFPLILLGS